MDLTDVELLMDAEDNSRVNLTSLLLDVRTIQSNNAYSHATNIINAKFFVFVYLPTRHNGFSDLNEHWNSKIFIFHDLEKHR